MNLKLKAQEVDGCGHIPLFYGVTGREALPLLMKPGQGWERCSLYKLTWLLLPHPCQQADACKGFLQDIQQTETWYVKQFAVFQECNGGSVKGFKQRSHVFMLSKNKMKQKKVWILAPTPFPKIKSDSILSLLSASCPRGIDLIMRVILNCK